MARFNSIIYKKSLQPEMFPSLKERLRELDPAYRDPEQYRKINIGLKRLETETLPERKRRQQKVLHDLRNNAELNKLNEENKLEIDVRAVQDEWLRNVGPQQVRTLALHTGIFRDLFGPYAYFDPLVPLNVSYDFSEDEVTPVFRGNIIKPREACNAPSVQYTSPPDALWTLKCTNPDGDLYKPDSECLHWLVTNIRGSDLSSGQELVPYLPPVPPRGVGYQRMVFVLYSQAGPIEDKEADQYRVKDALDLRERSFSTEQFYRHYESILTPAGLCWFNTDWDTSLNEYYNNTLGMKEPVFEYEFPKPHLEPQEDFPTGNYFLHYMDQYRDPKDVRQEMLVKRLKYLHPFKKETPRLPFPSAVPINHNNPSWVIEEIKAERNAANKYRELYRSEYRVDSMEDDALLVEAAEVEVDKKHMWRGGPEFKPIRLGIKKRRVIEEKEQEKEFLRRQKIVEEIERSAM